MKNEEKRKTVLEICREYYNNLDRSKLDQITPERGKEIFDFADIYRGIHENKDVFKNINDRFTSTIQKLISGKDDVISLVGYTVIESDDNIKHQQVSKSIYLANDAEKILFVLRSIDPQNKLFSNWNNIAQTLTTDTSSFLISASNYAKAKKIMMEYYDGFFDLKLILDEQSYLTYAAKLAEQKLNSGLKK